MASFAKESLSPLLKNANIRRRSLDLCQKLGNHLLSPNTSPLIFPSSPSKTSPSYNGENPCSSSSPFKLLSPQSPVFNYSYEEAKDGAPATATTSSNHYKRRASDSLWIGTLPLEPIPKETQPKQQRRRSLTFQYPLLDPTTSAALLRKRNKGTKKCSPPANQDEALSGEQETVGSEKQGNGVICNIIPPTPLKSTEGKVSSMPPLEFRLDQEYRKHGGCISSDESDEENDKSAVFEFDYNDNHVSSQLGRKEFEVSKTSTPPVKVNKGRRCSATKYDLDEGLMRMLSLNWNLSLDPDELLGKGSFGTVVGGSYQGMPVAVKVLKTTTAQRKASVIGEDIAMSLPSHNHVARIMDILYIGPDQTLIIMEKVEKGNLLSLLNDPSFDVTCSMAINISKQIALALVFCHRSGILHLDVKPQNILVDGRNCCKLSDFGNSKKVENLCSGQKYSTLEGTVPYTAPELFKGSKPTEKCDVYSFGITMWQILTREMPYENVNEHIVIFRVVSQGLRPDATNDRTDINCNNLTTEERSLSLKYKELYERAWNSSPDLRPSMSDIHKNLIEIQLL